MESFPGEKLFIFQNRENVFTIKREVIALLLPFWFRCGRDFEVSDIPRVPDVIRQRSKTLHLHSSCASARKICKHFNQKLTAGACS